MELERLPGGTLIQQGLTDLQSGQVTIASLLVAIGAERMRRAGLDIPTVTVDEPEMRLYAILESEDSDAAHSRYNALIRQLVSFERALECAA